MTYKKLYEDALFKLEHNKITLGEFEKMIKPLEREVEQEPILDKIRAEIKALSPEPTAYDVVDGNPIKDAVWETLADVLQIIDKNKVESEEV